MQMTIRIEFTVETDDAAAVEATINNMLDDGVLQDEIGDSLAMAHEAEIEFLTSDVTVEEADDNDESDEIQHGSPGACREAGCGRCFASETTETPGYDGSLCPAAAAAQRRGWTQQNVVGACRESGCGRCFSEKTAST